MTSVARTILTTITNSTKRLYILFYIKLLKINNFLHYFIGLLYLSIFIEVMFEIFAFLARILGFFRPFFGATCGAKFKVWKAKMWGKTLCEF